MVDIYLTLEPQSPFLSIPNSDVERLSNRPFRWLRYVMFSICGAPGDLFKTLDPTDGPVDYNTSLADLPAVIYYKPSGDCVFVDYECLNDRITSTEQTRRSESFRIDVLLRDGSCVITGMDAPLCDAAHLIPRSKGDEYIAKVVDIRSHLYSQPPEITGIDDAQNGMLLRKDVHTLLGFGMVAFLMTPNYGLEPTDIKRVGSAHVDHHITLQQLEKPRTDNPTRLASLIETAEWQPGDVNAALGYGAHLDVQFRGPPPSPPPPSPPPPALILDYTYGIAAYRCWRSRQDSDKVHAVMENYHSANYAHIPPFPRQTDDDEDSSNQSDNHANPSWEPYKSKRREVGMVAAMDELNLVLMKLQGITPQEAAIRREKRMEGEELKAQEASLSKVTEWRKTVSRQLARSPWNLEDIGQRANLICPDDSHQM